MVDVCLLGTGGMMPLPERWLSSLLVRCNGRMMLIDCGEGTQIPMKMAGWGFKNLDAILITHYHADHVAGLPGLLLTLANSGRQEPVRLIGPPGLAEVVSGLLTIAPGLPYPIYLYTCPADGISHLEMDGLLIRCFPVDHWIPCLAYSIELRRPGRFDAEKARELDIPVRYWKQLQKGETVEWNGRSFRPDQVMGEPRRGIKICYCTDTRPVDGLCDFVREADLLVCEGMYGDEGDAEKAILKKHMLFAEAARVAREAGVCELWLTHFSPALACPEDWLSHAKEVFEPTIAGHDLMRKTLTFPS